MDWLNTSALKSMKRLQSQRRSRSDWPTRNSNPGHGRQRSVRRRHPSPCVCLWDVALRLRLVPAQISCSSGPVPHQVALSAKLEVPLSSTN